MTDPNENQPLGQSISEIVDRTTKIVHEEIELAKAELAISLQNLLRGSVAGIVGGVFAFFGLFVLLIGLSFLVADAVGAWYPWLGFLIVALILFLCGGLLALFALKKIKKGSQLVPKQAIAEAKATQSALQSELDGQEIDSVAVEETTGEKAEEKSEEKTDEKIDAKPDEKTDEAAEVLAAAKEIVDTDPPRPTFVTERSEVPEALPDQVPFGEGDKAAKKAEKAAAKAQAKADKEAAKERQAAEKEAAKAQKVADKALKKAGSQQEQQPSDEGDES